jgi:hypothetical protein
MPTKAQTLDIHIQEMVKIRPIHTRLERVQLLERLSHES